MNSNDSQNPTVINSRYNEVSNSRGNMIIVLIINIPQIIAAIIVLSIFSSDINAPCDESYTNKWKVWSSLSAMRMILYTIAVVVIYRYKTYFEEHPEQYEHITSFRNTVDGMGLVWFIIGNLWIFGDDNNNNSNGPPCNNPEKSPIYNLCMSMLIITYIQICLPCILVALFLPLFCFCMPCLIRLVARLNSRATPVSIFSSVLQLFL